MLKKSNRITKDKEFDRAFKTGQSFYTKLFGIKAADNSLEAIRLGVLVSTKVSKKAVIRNKVKRQTREIIQKELPILKNGKDIVIIVFQQILEKNFEEIKESIISGLKKLKLYK
ncbi:MAG: ribonuclease P protein component [Patescibacteria group bacterium]|jgi:ribonuclease P protein component